ncbi:transcriptional regulator [Cellulomonas chitinilytica]|uniref:Transcriptional regulator n=1 Tax=Cellulomonas chitinilytica TaxID=398759 RepID=A0A919U3L5_9CELL|nr:transcriptional regulator [Cellulomonas chitinilytica]
MEARLDGVLTHRLTVVAAGAGWGKTTAVASWCRHRDVRTAWVVLEPRDDTPSAVWLRVVEAVRASGAVPAEHELMRLRVPPTVTAPFATRLLHLLEQLAEQVVLVLDDFQVVHDPQALAAVGDLVRYALPLHVVVVTRADPPLTLQRMSLDGRVDHVRAEHLAFDAQEVQALAAAEQVPLSAAGSRVLLDRTEGWPVGVRLGLRQPADPRTGTPTGLPDPDRAVGEYLLEEVLAAQKPEVRDFLVRTSVATTLTPELAEAIVPGAPAHRYLAELVASNDFVTPLGGGYRYHPLLRDMLMGTLRFEDPAGFRDAHVRAARWLVVHGDPLHALDHAASAGSWDLFGEIFVEAGAALVAGPQREAVLSAARRVPFVDAPQSALLELCAATDACVRGRIPAGHLHVRRARALLDELPVEHRAAADVLVEILAAHVALGRGDLPGTVSAATAATRVLDGTAWPFPAFEHYGTWVHDLRATGLCWEGDVDLARAELDRMLRDVDPTVASLTTLNGHAYLALCDAIDGRYDDAARRADGTLVLAENAGWQGYEHLRPAYAASALAALVRGDWHGADRTLAYGFAADVGGDEPVLLVALHALQVRVAVASGRIRAARVAFEQACRDATDVPLPPVAGDLLARAATDLAVHALTHDQRPDLLSPPARTTREVLLVCQARTALARHDVTAAVAAAREVLAAGVDLLPLTRVEALLVLAGTAELVGDTAGADAWTRQALDEAADARLVQPFVVRGPAPLRSAVDRAVARRSDELAVAIGGHLGRGAPVTEPTPLVMALTDRELVILTALATMQSNAEIAGELFVSVNTVKAHLKSVFRKLDVTTRRGAVRRGRDLGLLP